MNFLFIFVRNSYKINMAARILFNHFVTKNLLNRNYSSHVDKKHLQASITLWKNLTIFAVPVAIGLGFVNVFLHEEEHGRPEFIPYDHLRVRTTPFPWGDGTRSLFHNPHVNALPTGYEHDE